MKTVRAFFPLPGMRPGAYPPALRPGEREAGAAEPMPHIPGFRLIERCGRGGSGSVYLGIDRDGVRRAVRVLRPDANRAGGVERETAAVARYRDLAHGNDHLIDILYSGHAGATFYQILPLADSASERRCRYRPLTLAEKLRQGGVTPEEKLKIVRDIAATVAFLHEHGVAHRDLKPENILFVDGVLKIADPGLLAPTHCLSTGGTRAFSPPRPRSAFRTDLYAVGMIMYSVFTGLPPESFPELPPGWNDGFHSRLDRLIIACCAPDGKGCRSTAELVAELDALELPSPRWSFLRKAWHRTRRSAELWLTILALLFGMVSCCHAKSAAPSVRAASLYSK